MPDNTEQGGSTFIEKHSGIAVLIGAQGQPVGETVCGKSIDGLRNRPGQGANPIMGPLDEQVVRDEGQGKMAESHWAESLQRHLQGFFQP